MGEYYKIPTYLCEIQTESVKNNLRKSEVIPSAWLPEFNASMQADFLVFFVTFCLQD